MDASTSLSLVLLVLTLHSVIITVRSSSSADLPAAQPSHRRLLLPDTTNLAAISSNVHVPVSAHVPSDGSGSFPASAGQREGDGPSQSEAAPSPAAYLSRSMRWLYMIALPAVGLLLLAGLACRFLCRKSAVATIRPWKTGLSGQLQKAFVTGTVPL